MAITDSELENSPLLELLGGFIVELREAGLPVTVSDTHLRAHET